MVWSDIVYNFSYKQAVGVVVGLFDLAMFRILKPFCTEPNYAKKTTNKPALF